MITPNKFNCTCGKTFSYDEAQTKGVVIEENYPLHDYNDLVPSCLIEWSKRRRFATEIYCPVCGKLVFVSKGVILPEKV